MLLSCHVEDWAPDCGPNKPQAPLADMALDAKLAAFHAQRAARRAWLADHGITSVAEQRALIPPAYPRFRDYRAWCARWGVRDGA
ncbi:hypothetical protein [Streptosporangium sandarakinum]|uniref:hypothetical protein n=1 Tax=Streptosporangium sandarakinum TaxID=1260955 RepID=UPI003718EC03